MTPPILAFFNKGGDEKASWVYHMAWKYVDLGYSVIAVDLDPQANLSAAFLDDERLEELWPEGRPRQTICGLLSGGVDKIADPHLEQIWEGAINPSQLGLGDLYGDPLHLVVGDLQLSGFEEDLGDAWSRCLSGDARVFRVMSAFWRIVQRATDLKNADVVLLDLGPNLGAINRAALLAADFVVFPLSGDLFSLQALQNLGPALREWRAGWSERLGRNPERDLVLPAGKMQPVGYIVQQHPIRLDRPVNAYDRWMAKIPEVYRKAVLNEPTEVFPQLEEDPQCLILLKRFRSLMPLAQVARKPMFHLKPADGAIGTYAEAVKSVDRDFTRLATTIAERIGLSKGSG